ncbi:unnamed protein product [Orchesella dallaii]|uniref:Transmembrane protein n=1 Tax=Orchesella dallaii TaxID=48710 RepID=A0ABP1QN62_9HEXA
MYYRPESVVEVFVLATTIVSFVISVMYLATDQYLKTYTVRKFDAGIHSIMGIIMLCVSTVFLLIIEQNDIKCYHDSCLETHAFRILCGVFGVIVGVLYGIIGILLTSEKQVFAVIAFILVVDNYSKNLSNEEAFFYTIMICMIISIIMAVLSLVGLMENNNIRMVDNIFHTVAALAAIITGILFLISVFEYRKYSTNSLFAKRLASGILGLIYGLICANMGWLLFRG